MGYTRDDIIDLVVENDVKFIRLQFTDILGVFKNVAITVSQLEKALNNQCMLDGSSIEGFVRIEESDMYLKPDLDTFVVFPWRPQHGKVARFICDIYTPDGKPFEGSPRYVLQKTLKRAEAMGYQFNVGPECEFFLFQTDDAGKPTLIPHDNGSYFDLGPVDMGENTRREICLTLEDMGFEIETSHHENAPGQHEVDFRYEEALRAADNIMTLKLVVKTVAQRNGLFASFMPKPLNGVNGSGMHANLSLSKNGKNAFYDENDKNGYGLSLEAYQFMAGVLAHMKGMSVITNPIVNSYKRIISGFEAPVYLAWSAANRSPLIRIPTSRPESKRIELRCPDTACNPYLEFAAILSAGLDGIERGMTPPPAVEGNIYEMSDEQRKSLGIERLPKDLGEAINEFEKDSLIQETLGEHVCDKYLKAKKHEWEEYRSTVTDWELNRYRNIY
ncbi:MAG: type I glutamate--ammonia ligase [Lachnospiraceae bacterium]|nr:type I glutamate--ammonia ligase [Lachnospiraceae bacterium]